MGMKKESREPENDNRDDTDEAGWESFPASDPPAHRPERTAPAPRPDPSGAKTKSGSAEVPEHPDGSHDVGGRY